MLDMVATRLDPLMIKNIERTIRVTGQTRSDFIRRAIWRELKRHENKRKRK